MLPFFCHELLPTKGLASFAHIFLSRPAVITRPAAPPAVDKADGGEGNASHVQPLAERCQHGSSSLDIPAKNQVEQVLQASLILCMYANSPIARFDYPSSN